MRRRRPIKNLLPPYRSFFALVKHVMKHPNAVFTTVNSRICLVALKEIAAGTEIVTKHDEDDDEDVDEEMMKSGDLCVLLLSWTFS